MIERSAVIYVKTIGNRQLLFCQQEHVDSFDSIVRKHKRGMSMSDALELFGNPLFVNS